MPIKKTTIYILLAVIIFTALFGFFGIKQTSADEEKKCVDFSGTPIVCPPNASPGSIIGYDPKTGQETVIPSKTGSPTKCNIGWSNLGDIFSMACMVKAAATISSYIIWTPAKLIFTISSYAMDTSIDLAINKFREFAASDAVTTGWGFARDIVNLFLIFILLYIAIATILQISGYGAKELLITLIIIAFIVNFSLVITKLIIDASNILALEFYKPFSSSGTGVSATFKNAFDADAIINSSFEGKPEESINLYLVQLITFTFGGGILLIAAFVFFIFAVLFIIRVVSLLVLMVCSPLAFAAHALPSTNKHAKKWWDYLFSQAFFAPAALFMIWLSANIANSPFIKTALGLKDIKGKGFSDMLFAASTAGKDTSQWNWNNILVFIMQFVIVAVFLIFSLIIAKQMGAAGAESVQKGATKASRKIQGYAGRVTGRTVIARPARRLAESKIGKKIGSIPIVGGAMYRGVERAAKVGKLEEVTAKSIETKVKLGQALSTHELQNYFPKLDPRAQEALYNKMSERQRAALLAANRHIFDSMFARMQSIIGEEAVTEMKAKLGNSLPTATERKNFFDAHPEVQTRMFEIASARERVELLKGLSSVLRNELMSRLSLEEREKTEKTEKEIERKEKIKQLAQMLPGQLMWNIKAIKPDEIPDLDVSVFKDPAKLAVLVNNLGASHAKKILEREDQATVAFFTHLASLGSSVEEIAKKLEMAGNRSLAGWVRSGPASKAVLESYGMGKPSSSPAPKP